MPRSAIKYVPPDKELLWVEVRKSSKYLKKKKMKSDFRNYFLFLLALAMDGAGNGLFAKVSIQSGTVMCEYRGIIREIGAGNVDLHPYGVQCVMPDNSIKMIDGIDERGDST